MTWKPMGDDEWQRRQARGAEAWAGAVPAVNDPAVLRRLAAALLAGTGDDATDGAEGRSEAVTGL